MKAPEKIVTDIVVVGSGAAGARVRELYAPLKRRKPPQVGY